MKTIFSKFLILLTALTFVGCERDADVDIPETKPKLVLVAFITPQDSFITVSITRSKPIFESYTVNTSDAVTDATVTLYGNNTSIQIPFDWNYQIYRLSTTQFQILGGNEYKLTASTPQGESASATTVVPATSVNNTYTVNGSDSIISYAPDYLTVKLNLNYSFTDDANESNKYRFFSAAVFRDTLMGNNTTLRIFSTFFTDENANGQTISRNLQTTWSNYNPSSNDSLIAYDCWMFHVNDDYYQYHESLYNYSGGGDPFAEPTLIYTNVTGGLGVFAAANGNRIRILR